MACAAVLSFAGCASWGAPSQETGHAQFIDPFCSVERARSHFQAEILRGEKSIAEGSAVHFMLENTESAATTFEDTSLEWPDNIDREDLLVMAKQYRFDAETLRALSQGSGTQEGFGDTAPETLIAFGRLTGALGIDVAYAECGID